MNLSQNSGLGGCGGACSAIASQLLRGGVTVRLHRCCTMSL
jgi:hypothetical protein